MMTSRIPSPARWLLLAGIALALAIPSLATAQESTTAPATAKTPAVKSHGKAGASAEQRKLNEHLQQMTERLKLSPEQAAKVKPIMQAHWSQSRELMAKFKGQPASAETKAAMEKAHQDLQADTDSKLAQVLTPDQMTALKAMRTEHKDKEGAKAEKVESEK